jgi:hypothetical protein
MFSSEFRDRMRIDWDIPIEVSHGLALRADVFRPEHDEPHPVLITYGPYAKGLPFQAGYPSLEPHGRPAPRRHRRLHQPASELGGGGPGEVGFPRVRVRQGRLPGHRTLPRLRRSLRPPETQDFYESIEWAAVQPGRTGRWAPTASRTTASTSATSPRCSRPPGGDVHLGRCRRQVPGHDSPRGIVSTFWANWHDMQVKTVQYGSGERGRRNPITGQLICGDETLSEDELAAYRCEFGADIRVEGSAAGVPAGASRLRVGHRRAHSSPTPRTSSRAADRSSTTTRAIGHPRCSAALPACTLAGVANPACCCPSFRRRNRHL